VAARSSFALDILRMDASLKPRQCCRGNRTRTNSPVITVVIYEVMIEMKVVKNVDMLSSVVWNVLMLTSVTVIGGKVTSSVSWIVIGVVYTVVSVCMAVIV
jgi:hypothetical protein